MTMEARQANSVDHRDQSPVWMWSIPRISHLRLMVTFIPKKGKFMPTIVKSVYMVDAKMHLLQNNWKSSALADNLKL